MRKASSLFLFPLLLLASLVTAQSSVTFTFPPSTQPSILTITTSPGAVASTSGSSVTPATQPATQPTSQPATQPAPVKMVMGVNVSANDPWSTDGKWNDVAHQMGGWFAAVVQGAAITSWDANGYPMAVSLGGVARANMQLYGYPPGPYTFTWTGTQTGLVLGRGGKMIGNITGDGKGNWTGTCTFNSGDLLEIQQTGGQTNIHIYAPDAVPGMTFRKQFLDAVRPYKVVRLMPLARVNAEMRGGPAGWPVLWAQRNVPSNWDQTSKEVALEYQLELAKEAGVIPWINTYYGESDDALTQTAQLVKTFGFPLVVVESQNEYWNFGAMYQGKMIRDDALAAGTYNTLDPNVAGARRAASIGANVGKIFRQVLGAGAVKMVFGAQAAWGAWAHDGLSYVPPGSFDAVAVAPYFNNVGAMAPTATIADWEASCSTWINTVLDNGMGENQAAAQAAGVELWCYEGGPSLFPVMANPPSMTTQPDSAAQLTAFNADVVTQFYLDPAMGRLHDQLFAMCRRHNVAEFSYFLLCGYWGKSGYWGEKQFLSDPETPRTQAIQRAIAAGN